MGAQKTVKRGRFSVTTEEVLAPASQMEDVVGTADLSSGSSNTLTVGPQV